MLTIPARRLLPGDRFASSTETVLEVQDTGDGTEVTTSETLAHHTPPLYFPRGFLVTVEGTD